MESDSTKPPAYIHIELIAGQDISARDAIEIFFANPRQLKELLYLFDWRPNLIYSMRIVIFLLANYKVSKEGWDLMAINGIHQLILQIINSCYSLSTPFFI